MSRSPDAGSLPLPAIPFEVTKGGFLPIAQAIGITAEMVGIRNPSPGFGIRLIPKYQHGGTQPARFLKNQSVGAQVLTGLHQTR